MCRVEQRKNYVKWVNMCKSGLQKKDVTQKLEMLKTGLEFCVAIWKMNHRYQWLITIYMQNIQKVKYSRNFN